MAGMKLQFDPRVANPLLCIGHVFVCTISQTTLQSIYATTNMACPLKNCAEPPRRMKLVSKVEANTMADEPGLEGGCWEDIHPDWL